MLKIEILELPKGKAFRVVEQDGRDYSFKASNDFEIWAEAYPVLMSDDMGIWVRGEHKNADDMIVPIDKEIVKDVDTFIECMAVAVREFNEAPLKPKPVPSGYKVIRTLE